MPTENGVGIGWTDGGRRRGANLRGKTQRVSVPPVFLLKFKTGRATHTQTQSADRSDASHQSEGDYVRGGRGRGARGDAASPQWARRSARDGETRIASVVHPR